MTNKCLIIDNDSSIAEMLKDHLDIRGYDAIVALSGREGIDTAKEFKPDIILLDILMPEMDGFETLKMLKEDPETSDIPVILDSIMGEFKEKGLQLGAVDFISKPIELEKLYSTVEKVMSNYGRADAILVIDDDESIVEMTCDFLENKGIKVIGTVSALEGINIAQEKNIGLIIVDLKMPEMDGYEVIKRIKANNTTSHIPIIVVTSVDLDKCREKCLMLGAEECFSKSLKMENLVEEVKVLMDKMTQKASINEFKAARILVADDEKIILELVRDILEAKNFDVVSAIDGEDALEKIYTESPDLVVLDVKMPKLTGYEVCERVRADVLTTNLPIIMLTAKSAERDEIRGLEYGVDDYITKPFNPSILLARIRSALSRSQQGINVNPLTYLPGNTVIAKEIEQRLREKEDFAVLYVDIDQFKAYNDYYGFHRGDGIIKEIARIMVNSMKKHNPDHGFVGHIGGDDFISIVNDNKIDLICQDMISEFDSVIPSYYDKEDRDNGYVIIENRKGEKEQFPVMTISIGVVTTSKKDFTHIGEISKAGAELKKFAKKEEKSNYVVDRRRG